MINDAWKTVGLYCKNCKRRYGAKNPIGEITEVNYCNKCEKEYKISREIK